MARRTFGTVRKLPSGRFQARYPDPSGRRVSVPGTFATKTEAIRFLSTVETDLLRGQYVDPRAGDQTFVDWVEVWLASNPRKRATTLSRDRQVLDSNFLPLLGSLKLSAITPLHVRRAVDAMEARVSPGTVRTNVGVLRAVLNAAVDADLIARSPARGIKVATAESKERGTLTPDELYRLAAEVPRRYRRVILVAGVLGFRWSEVVGLEIGDVDFLRRTLSVNRTIAEVGGRQIEAPTKTRAGRRQVSIPDFLLEELAQHIAEFRRGALSDEPLFVGARGARLRRTFTARHLHPAAKRAGLDPSLDFHGLRHVAASFLVDDDAHPRVIMARLGHSTQRLSMELYSHVSDELDRRIAKQLNATFVEARRTPAAP
jgi:integrase